MKEKILTSSLNKFLLTNRYNMIRLLLSFLIIISGFLASSFQIANYEQALVIRFGKVLYFTQNPGLHFKLPIVDNVIVLNNKILSLFLIEKEMNCADAKKIIITSNIKYKITDPNLFYQTLHSYENAKITIATTAESAIRNQIGKSQLTDLLSDTRAKIMQDIEQKLTQICSQYGISIIDFQINKADLPIQNANKVYERMISDRQKEIILINQEGHKEANIIRQSANVEYEKIVNTGKIKAAHIRAQAIEYETNQLKSLFESISPELLNAYINLKYQSKILKNTKDITIPYNSDLTAYVLTK